MSSTPPVVRNGFAFANDSFYAEASNQNQHRRATVPELVALFRPSAAAKKTASIDKGPVGHWYEAQLIHYGLQPSKSKAVAKSRLLDAVNRGNLAVPAHILKLEEQLKKEWWKNERAARKHGKKGEEHGPGPSVVQVSQPARSYAKVQPKKDPQSKKTASAKKTPSKSTDTVRASKAKINAEKPATYVFPSETSPSTQVSRKQTSKKRASNVRQVDPLVGHRHKQYARKTASNIPWDRPNSPETPSKGKKRTDHPTAPPRSKARKMKAQGLDTTDKPTMLPSQHEDRKCSSSDEYLDPNRYDSFDSQDEDCSRSESRYAESEENETPHVSRRLGLLNGEYTIESSDLDQWSNIDPEDFSLILCLEGSSMWGAYDFGMFSGIMHFEQRPWQASDEPVRFNWRGREHGEGEISYGDEHQGWVRFLGEGQIEGMISCYGNAMFYGHRVRSNETRAPRDVQSMRREWQEYSESRHEYESRARWGSRGGW